MLVLMTCTMLVAAPIMCVGGVIMALREDVGLSWLMAVSVPVLIVAIGLVIIRMVPQFRLMQVRIDTVNRVLREQITGIRVVRAFVREPVETERFRAANTDLTAVALAAGRLLALIFPIVHAGAQRLQRRGAVVRRRPHRRGPDADRRADGVPHLPDADPDVGHDGHLHGDHGAAGGRLRRADRGGARHRVIGRAVGRADRAAARRRATWRSTTSRSATRVRPRRCCATSPSPRTPGRRRRSSAAPAPARPRCSRWSRGCSTSPAGAVLVDGVDVRELEPDDLWARDRPGAAAAVPVHRHGREQPALRQPGRHRRRAVGGAGDRPGRATSCDGDARAGLDAPIAQGGTNVSGGQRQRLAIARALVRRPEIYLFDDSFSALDLATDARLRAALQPVTARRRPW